MRILYHAINGTGLGHLMRLSSIAAEVRLRQPDIHQFFVTNSAFPDQLRRSGFPFMTLPLDDASPFEGIDRRLKTLQYRTTTKLLYHAINEYAPDVTVFDTHFSTLLVRRLQQEGRKMALVLRECRNDYLRLQFNENTFSAFGLVLLPHTAEYLRSQLEPDLAAQLERLPFAIYTGPIVRPVKLTNENILRIAARYDIKADEILLVITCGAGGYRHSSRVFVDKAQAAALELKQEIPALRIVVAGGPYAEKRAWRAGVDFVSWEPEMPLLLARANLAVAHGGYNTVHELRQAGTPAVVVPLQRKNESQAARVNALSATGRVRSIDLEASIAEYRSCFLEVLKRPRPNPEIFNGSERAAKSLIQFSENTDPVLAKSRLPAGAKESEQDEQQHRPPWVSLHWNEVDTVLAEASKNGERTTVRFDIYLGDGAVEELQQRACQVLMQLDGVSVARQNILLSFSDGSGGKLLAELAKVLAPHSFSCLVARIPAQIVEQTSGLRQTAFEVGRHYAKAFKVDITTAEAPCLRVDQP